jgi:hypothetical protein
MRGIEESIRVNLSSSLRFSFFSQEINHFSQEDIFIISQIQKTSHL